jgi:hypothetical protein
MHRHREGRGLETLNRVTSRAVTTILAGIELPMMRIGFMAIQTFLECDGPVQISPQVTQFAAHTCMLSQQGVFGGGMIEPLAHCRRGDLLPTRRGVTGFARGLKNPVMRIGVAIAAGVESQAHIFENLRIVGFRLVAFLAPHSIVLAR